MQLKPPKKWATFGVVCAIIISGCLFNGASEKTDYCEILSFSPAVVSADSEITINAVIRYELKTADSAELHMGFNTKEPKVTTVYESGNFIVKRGKGEIKWNEKTIPKKWSDGSCFSIRLYFAPILNEPKRAIYQEICIEIK